MTSILKLSRFKTPEAFASRIHELEIDLPFDAELEAGPKAPLASSLETQVGTLGNRFAILPMEGWDGTREGLPTDLVRRRWRRFGQSGAKLIWGGEAVAVRHDGRANPNQLLLAEESVSELASLRCELVAAHDEKFDRSDDLVVGLQLTHSGRFARPDGEPRPRVAYRHPILDERVGVASDDAVFSDDELDELAEDFILATVRADSAGFQFVDIKHCHGYLGHELLSAVDRPGRYGGDLDNRMHFLRTVVAGVRARAPELAIGVRVSIFDFLPFKPGEDGMGISEPNTAGAHAFGCDASGLGVDLAETHQFLDALEALGIELVCTTAGSPYYNPHIQRPAFFAPSDGYKPPEDPLVRVARQIQATAQLRARHPRLVFVGSGYSYLQEWLPNVAQYAVREGLCDVVGLGRMVLSYPSLPADVLAGRPLERRAICRTFSDCTTAPRNQLVSGCYPIDSFYKERPEAKVLAAIKRARTR